MTLSFNELLTEAGLRGKLKTNVHATAGSTLDFVMKIVSEGWSFVDEIHGMGPRRMVALYYVLKTYGFEIPYPLKELEGE